MIEEITLDKQVEFEAQNILYSKKHDSYYNADTGAWVEKKCKDGACEFCKDRPETAYAASG